MTTTAQSFHLPFTIISELLFSLIKKGPEIKLKQTVSVRAFNEFM